MTGKGQTYCRPSEPYHFQAILIWWDPFTIMFSEFLTYFFMFIECQKTDEKSIFLQHWQLPLVYHVLNGIGIQSAWSFRYRRARWLIHQCPVMSSTTYFIYLLQSGSDSNYSLQPPKFGADPKDIPQLLQFPRPLAIRIKMDISHSFSNPDWTR